MSSYSKNKRPHDHEHDHKNIKTHGCAFGIAIFLNTIYVVIEFIYGYIVNSAALVADASHNLSDILALLLAWIASILAQKVPSKHFTYGLRSTTILAALANALFLLVIFGGIAWEAIQRLAHPPIIAELTVIIVAAVGILINGFSARLFIKGSEEDINIRGAYLHMASDAAISLGVMLAGIGMMLTGWYWLDPAVCLIIVIIVATNTWGLLRESLKLALNAVPSGIDVVAIDTYLRGCRGVIDIHDLHIWGISTYESALTVHLVMPNGHPGDIFLDEIMQTLSVRFKIHHSTLQVELGTTNHACILNP